MAVYTICSNCGREIEKGTKCVCGIEKERYKRYNKYVRWNKENIKYSKFYSSIEWKRLVNYIRSKYNNMCLMCLIEKKEIVEADLIHHIIPIRDCWDKRLTENNLIPLCHSCHNNIDHTNITKDDEKHMLELIERYDKEF